MQPELLKWLEDIRDAATYIVDVTRGHSLSTYSSDRTIRQAVERNFEIIGEAVNRIGRDDEAVAAQFSDRRRIVAFRNILIHGYDNIEHEIVWVVIQESLPQLLREVSALLKDHT